MAALAEQALVLSRADLEAFDPRPGRTAEGARFCCPLPACQSYPCDGAHQSLSLNAETGLWTCYRCKAGGKLRDLWEPRTRAQLQRAAALRSIQVRPDPQPGQAASAAKLGPMLERCRPVAGTPGEGYLAKRGVPVGVATDAGVLFSADWFGRPAVVFPLRDRDGQIVAANGRHTDGRNDPKTHTVGDRKLGVFATPGALDADSLVVVEGPLDALSLAVCAVPAVALVTTRAPHWLRVAAAFRRVVTALDADQGGDEGAEHLIAEITPFARAVERLRPCVGKDWNDGLIADPGGLRQALTGLLPATGTETRAELLSAPAARRTALLALAEAAGWPRVEWNTHHIGPGADAWQERVPRLNALYVAAYAASLERRLDNVLSRASVPGTLHSQ